jgi:hypothetical protein
MDGNYVELTRPLHVFPDLGVDLLCGIDSIREEGIDIFFSSTVPQMRIASCLNAAVRINVLSGKQVTKVPVRTTATVVLPANSTSIVEIKVSRQLPTNQDYLFTPSMLKSVSASGSGTPHAVVSHDQKNVMFTNLHDTDKPCSETRSSDTSSPPTLKRSPYGTRQLGRFGVFLVS